MQKEDDKAKELEVIGATDKYDAVDIVNYMFLI